MYTQYAKIVKRRCTGTKKASDFSEAYQERKTRLELATPTLARSCSTK